MNAALLQKYFPKGRPTAGDQPAGIDVKHIHTAQYRLEVIQTIYDLMRDQGLSQSSAADQVKVSMASYHRWRVAYNTAGVSGLFPKFSNCGRKPKEQNL